MIVISTPEFLFSFFSWFFLPSFCPEREWTAVWCWAACQAKARHRAWEGTGPRALHSDLSIRCLQNTTLHVRRWARTEFSWRNLTSWRNRTSRLSASSDALIVLVKCRQIKRRTQHPFIMTSFFFCRFLIAELPAKQIEAAAFIGLPSSPLSENLWTCTRQPHCFRQPCSGCEFQQSEYSVFFSNVL